MDWDETPIAKIKVSNKEHKAMTDITKMSDSSILWFVVKRFAKAHKFGIVVTLFVGWVVLVDTPLAQILIDYLHGVR